MKNKTEEIVKDEQLQMTQLSDDRISEFFEEHGFTVDGFVARTKIENTRIAKLLKDLDNANHIKYMSLSKERGNDGSSRFLYYTDTTEVEVDYKNQYGFKTLGKLMRRSAGVENGCE